MPFCSNCGRELAENEVCNCQSVQNNNTVPPRNNAVPPQQNVNITPPPVYSQNGNVPPGFQQFDQYGRPLFTPQGQPISYDANGNAIIGGQKKKNAGCLIALVIVLVISLPIIGILAAILVPSMLGYVNKSKIASINADTKTISHSVISALSDMEVRGYDLGGAYIICSDQSENRALDSYGSGIDTSTLYNYIEQYYSSIDEYDWFAVVENGVVTYCAANRKTDNDVVGTYPNMADLRQGPATYSGSYAGKDADLDDLYENVYYYFN